MRLDDLLAVLGQGVDVAERRRGRPNTLLGLLHLSLACFLREVVDVVLGHDAMHALSDERESRDSTTPSLSRWIFDIQFVERHPVLEIAVEPMGLLYQYDPYVRILAQIFDHLIEVVRPLVLAVSTYIYIYIYIFLHDAELVWHSP